jgi:hypothetical protein
LGRLVVCKYKESVTQSQAVLDIADLPWQHLMQQYTRLGAVVAAAPELGYRRLSSIVFPACPCQETIQLFLGYVAACATNINKPLTEKNRPYTDVNRPRPTGLGCE